MITFAALLLCAFSSLNAQLRSVNLFANYSNAAGSGAMRFDINRISAVGGGAELTFNVKDLFFVNINGGYSIYSISQDDALNKWNWYFWSTRYKGKINEALNPNLNPALAGSKFPSPVQKMYVMPFFLTIGKEIQVSRFISLIPQAGAGVMFYTRRLYIVEEWHKQIAGSQYDFNYSYRNFADDKVGNPLALQGGLDAVMKLSDNFHLYTSGRYVSVLKTEGKYGYDNFPMDGLYNINLGLTIIY